MKVTEHMILQFAGEPEITATDAHVIEQGLTRALKDVPDVVPFAYSGWPGAEKRHVFLHPPCGTVTDADPALTGEGSLWDAVQAGECDCETSAPWLRIYVEREA